MARLSTGDRICCNARCDSSWQATRRAFETSLLGAAVRQMHDAAMSEKRQ